MIDTSQLVESLEKEEIMDKFKNTFIGSNIKGNILWNFFVQEPTPMNFDNLKTINLPNKNNIYFYIEQKKVLYNTNLDSACEYAQNLNEHGIYDSYIFDQSFDWVIAITHEDNIVLTLGL